MIELTEQDFADCLKSPAVLKFLGLKCERTLIRWRRRKIGPPCLRIGRDFYYPRVHLELFKIQREADKAKAKVRVTRRNKFTEKLRAALATGRFDARVVVQAVELGSFTQKIGASKLRMQGPKDFWVGFNESSPSLRVSTRPLRSR